MAEQGIVIIFEGGSRLRCFEDGSVFRWYPKQNVYKEINNISNCKDGYNHIRIEGKIILRHRLIMFAFQDFDFINSDLFIDHINHDRLNNSIDNLRVVTNQQNQFNRSNTKGYTWSKQHKKYQAQIMINRKHKHLGLFDDEESARQAYLDAKKIHHII